MVSESTYRLPLPSSLFVLVGCALRLPVAFVTFALGAEVLTRRVDFLDVDLFDDPREGLRLALRTFKLLFLGPGLVGGRVSTSASIPSSSSSSWSLYAMRFSTTLGENETLDAALFAGRDAI
jgi:hypothetical protein